MQPLAIYQWCAQDVHNLNRVILVFRPRGVSSRVVSKTNETKLTSNMSAPHGIKAINIFRSEFVAPFNTDNNFLCIHNALKMQMINSSR